MKIAITGAKGFTGRHFLTEATVAGHDVSPLTSDINDSDGLTRELSEVRPDALVHLAAISFVGHAQADEFYKVNVVGTTNLLSAICSANLSLRSVLIASSANIYGNSDRSPISEDEVPSPVNHYATSKLAMEYMAKTFSDRLPITLVRPFNYTGPGQGHNFVIPKIVEHFRQRANSIELGNVHVHREFNDVRMVCAAYLALLDTQEHGKTFNICSGKTYTLQDVINELQTLTGHHLDIRVNPSFVRSNEIHRLCGDPKKLMTYFADHNLAWTAPRLSQTLAWMLSSA